MSNLTPLIAATWGFCGAVPVAGQSLITALAKNAEVTPKVRNLAVAQFAVALFAGPAAAGALAPLVVESWKVGHGMIGPPAFLIGLMANGFWPVLTSRKTISKVLNALGGKLLDASKIVGTDDEP